MLRRDHRFHGHGSVRRLYTNSQQVRSSSMSLRYSVRSGQKPYRVAVVVSRKVHKSAVVRNRIRRRIYEDVRRQAVLLQPGDDLVFTVFQADIATMPANEPTGLIEHLLHKRRSSASNPAHAIVKSTPNREV